MRRLGASVGITALVAVSTFSGAIGAAAAPGDTAEAEGAFLAGQVLGLDLGALIDSAEAGYPSNPGTDTGGAALPDVTVPVVGLPLFGPPEGDALLALSGISQQATVEGPNQPATASAGIASAEINVTPWVADVPAVSAAIDDLRLTLEAIEATATANPGEVPTGTYSIAGATIDAHSPVLGDVSTTV